MAFFWAAAADATTFSYVVSGTVDADNSYDDESLFGDLAGARFTATFLVDDSLATASYHYDAGGSRADGGGGFLAGTTPPLTATLSINGYSVTVPQGDAVQVPVFDPVTGDASGPSSSEQDQGSVVKDAAAQTLDLGATYKDTYSCCATAGVYGGDSSRGLFVSLAAFGFTDPDFRQTGSFGLSSESNGFFYDTVSYTDRHGSSTNFSNISLLAQTLTVTALASAVPEPSAWATMTLGLAAIGGLARRRQGRPAAA